MTRVLPQYEICQGGIQSHAENLNTFSSCGLIVLSLQIIDNLVFSYSQRSI
jgi:hypothetical protein